MGKSRYFPCHLATAVAMFAVGCVSATTVHASPPKGRYHVVAGLANEDQQDSRTRPPVSRTVILRAVVWARASRGLQLARQAYLRSSFGWCQRRLLKVERESRGALQTAEDFETMKRLNQWLGLCTAVRGGKREAAAAFARAASLPGPSPDPQVFPPAIMNLYNKAVHATQGARCGPLKTSGFRPKLIDGRRFRSAEEVTIGQHYVAWEGGSGLVTISANCRLMPTKDDPLSEQDALVTSRELEDVVFAGILAERTRSKQLAFRHSGSGRRFVYRLADGRLTESGSDPQTQDLRATATSSRTSSRSSSKRRALSPGLLAYPPGPYSAASAEPHWYQRWWVWALVGGVVVTSVVIPIALTEFEGRSSPSFTLVF